ncbi:restriction endonuclease [Mesobacillus sp. LC4]
MTLLVQNAYDQIALEIVKSLQNGEKCEHELETEILSFFAISSSDLQILLDQMKRLCLIDFTLSNSWSNTHQTVSLINTNDSRLNSLISSFQFGEIPVIQYATKTNTEVAQQEEDSLLIFKKEIEEKINEYNNLLRLRLKEILLKMNEYRLEEVVVELLVKSGEGGYGHTTPKSNDGGIDGVVFESPLKRGAMLIQTKRYADHILVNKNEIHEFLSVCRTRGARTGYFVTTSSFSNTAISTARFDLCLVNGDQLIDMILKSGIGLLKEYGSLYSIDENYFLRPPLPSGQIFEVTTL